MLNIHSNPLPFLIKLVYECVMSLSGYLRVGQLSYCFWCHSLFHGPSSAVCMRVCKTNLPLTVVYHAYGKWLCVRVCVCLYHDRGPDGSRDTEDELASALVSMAAAGFIRLSLYLPQALRHMFTHPHKLQSLCGDGACSTTPPRALTFWSS